ncbi:MAG: hypothetical protein P4L46_15150 [Fimbriimonas sp.]|nr:hypothetical protein [Fimbriimonas sp.]
MVETSEYRIDRLKFRGAIYRTNFVRFWPIELFAFVGVVSLAIGGQYPAAAIAFIVFAVMLPMAVGKGVQRVLDSPLNNIPYVTRFTEDSLEQLSGGVRRSLSRYSDMASFDTIPEGIRVWAMKSHWILIPREAFATPGDFEAACRLLFDAGKMKQRRAR